MICANIGVMIRMAANPRTCTDMTNGPSAWVALGMMAAGESLLRLAAVNG